VPILVVLMRLMLAVRDVGIIGGLRHPDADNSSVLRHHHCRHLS